MGYQLIETVTVGSGGAASIEFTGIPQDGVDLVLRFSLRGTTSALAVRVWENGNTTQGSNILLRGDGSAVQSSANLSYVALQSMNSNTSNTFGSAELMISNYTTTNTKSISVASVSENNATAAFQLLSAAFTFGTAAITSLVLSFSSGNIVQYSSASIYMITE